MKIRTMTRVALFAALTAVGAFIRIPLGYSSITLQTFFTAMAGCVLGPWYGALSQLVYVALGLVGLPIFTQGGGIGYLMQPTCGFLIGLIPAAWVIGRIAGRKPGAEADRPGMSAGLRRAVRDRRAVYGADPEHLPRQGHGLFRHHVGGHDSVPSGRHDQDPLHHPAHAPDSAPARQVGQVSARAYFHFLEKLCIAFLRRSRYTK